VDVRLLVRVVHLDAMLPVRPVAFLHAAEIRDFESPIAIRDGAADDGGLGHLSRIPLWAARDILPGGASSRARNAMKTMMRLLLVLVLTPSPGLKSGGVSQSSQEDSQTVSDGLEVRIEPLKSVITSGETLQLRVEIRNIGKRDDIFICKDFQGPNQACGNLEATAFTPAELLKQIPLSPGEAFDDDKIWQGIASMKRLYGAKGYIDMTAGNTMSTHQNQPLLPDIYVQVVEGRQYRVGTVQILGLSATAENLLKSILEPGQIFDRQSFTDFLKEKRSLLPVDASDNDITVGRNHDDGILDIALDFRRCPGDKIPFPPVNVSVSVWDKYQFMPQSDRWFHVSD
jgi:hypothetical protein